MDQISLLMDIAYCKNVVKCIEARDGSHDCSKIVSKQVSPDSGLFSPEDFQLPEPWSGNIEEAPILFIG
jgi:hypothetical protein